MAQLSGSTNYYVGNLYQNPMDTYNVAATNVRGFQLGTDHSSLASRRSLERNDIIGIMNPCTIERGSSYGYI